VFRREIESAGFRLVEEPKLLKENYYMIFEKVDQPKEKPVEAHSTGG
jgi:hypothetical protein